jgi:hypothetical protein
LFALLSFFSPFAASSALETVILGDEDGNTAAKGKRPKSGPFGRHYCANASLIKRGSKKFVLDDGGDECLGFWIAYVREDTALRSSCLRTSARWMEESKDVVADAPISRVNQDWKGNKEVDRKLYDSVQCCVMTMRYTRQICTSPNLQLMIPGSHESGSFRPFEG